MNSLDIKVISYAFLLCEIACGVAIVVRFRGSPGSERGRGQLKDGRNIVAPPGNQAANTENKPRPVPSEGARLLDPGVG